MKKTLLNQIAENVVRRLREDVKKIYPTPNLELAGLIEKNIKGEAEARELYYELLEHLTDKDDIKCIQGIISDELDHQKCLEEMREKYSKIPRLEH